MERFVKKTLVFASLLIPLFGILLFLPPTPRASKSLLFAELKKDSLLLNTPSPRIIFVGGSNLSFGMNSREIRDSLQLNPINTAIHASMGIKYMLEKTVRYAKNGDIILFVPEYSHFYTEWDRGSEELLRMVLDVNKSNIKFLSLKQMQNSFLYTGNLILSKFNIFEYFRIKEGDVYTINSFNEFGDVDAHWTLENRHGEFKPDHTINIKEYNPQIMDEIKHIADILKDRGCMFFLSYPCYQETSYNNSIEAIKKIEKEYQACGLRVLGSPERYMMSDSLMFNTVYHINKQGVERRTKLLTEDLRRIIN